MSENKHINIAFSSENHHFLTETIGKQRIDLFINELLEHYIQTQHTTHGHILTQKEMDQIEIETSDWEGFGGEWQGIPEASPQKSKKKK